MTSASRFSLSSYTPHPPVRITILYLANVSSHHHHRRRDAFWTSADAIYIPVKVQHWVPPPGAAHFLYCTPSSALCTMLRYTKSPTRLCPPPGGGAACFLFLLPSWKSLHSTPKYPMQGAGWAQAAPSLAPFPSPALGRGRAAPRPRSPPSATWGGAASFFCRVVLFVWVFFVLFFFFCFLFRRFLKKKRNSFCVFFLLYGNRNSSNPRCVRPSFRERSCEDGAASERAATERNELWQWRDVWICLVFGFPLEQRWVWSVLG